MREYLETFYGPQGGVEFEFLEEMEYVLVECTECGLFYQRQIPDDFLIHRPYEKWIDPQKALDRLGTRRDPFGRKVAYAREITRVLSTLAVEPSRLKFLDFGMGWGDWLRMAAAFGVEVYGAELSEARIAYAAQYGIGIVSWDQIPGSDFDFINTEQVFEYLTDPFETLLHLKKGLKPGGLLKVSVPDARRASFLLRNPDWTIHPDWTTGVGSHQCSLNVVAPLEHINGFSHGSLVKMAERAGFELAEIPLVTKYAYGMYYTLKQSTLVRVLARNLVLPLREHRLKGTYLFFRNRQDSSEHKAL